MNRTTLSVNEYKKYIQSQKNICFNCDLFIDKSEHGSKIIMLFAEIFPFLSDKYGIQDATNLIKDYSNTNNFKHWFWFKKHLLGQHIGYDPTFDDIGKFFGKGFFIKICFSLLIFNKLFINAETVNSIIEKQKYLLDQLKKDTGFTTKDILIKEYEDFYILLNDKTIISYENESFYNENIIK